MTQLSEEERAKKCAEWEARLAKLKVKQGKAKHTYREKLRRQTRAALCARVIYRGSMVYAQVQALEKEQLIDRLVEDYVSEIAETIQRLERRIEEYSMTSNEERLSQLLTRRGYKAEQRQGYVILREPERMDGWPVSVSVLSARHISVSQAIDVVLTGSDTIHHVLCQCGKPLLQEQHKYHTVADGPGGDLLTHCPACQAVLSKETIRAIDDEESERRA